jgi:hypothetical protein
MAPHSTAEVVFDAVRKKIIHVQLLAEILLPKLRCEAEICRLVVLPCMRPRNLV